MCVCGYVCVRLCEWYQTKNASEKAETICALRHSHITSCSHDSLFWTLTKPAASRRRRTLLPKNRTKSLERNVVDSQAFLSLCFPLFHTFVSNPTDCSRHTRPPLHSLVPEGSIQLEHPSDRCREVFKFHASRVNTNMK